MRCADVGHILDTQVDVLTSDDVFFETLRNAAASRAVAEAVEIEIRSLLTQEADVELVQRLRAAHQRNC